MTNYADTKAPWQQTAGRNLKVKTTGPIITVRAGPLVGVDTIEIDTAAFRDQVLEEAARVVERYVSVAFVKKHLAAAIRALKEKP